MEVQLKRHEIREGKQLENKENFLSYKDSCVAQAISSVENHEVHNQLVTEEMEEGEEKSNSNAAQSDIVPGIITKVLETNDEKRCCEATIPNEHFIVSSNKINDTVVEDSLGSEEEGEIDYDGDYSKGRSTQSIKSKMSPENKMQQVRDKDIGTITNQEDATSSFATLFLDSRTALTDKDGFTLVCSKAQKQALKKIQVVKQSQPQFDQTEIFMLTIKAFNSILIITIINLV